MTTRATAGCLGLALATAASAVLGAGPAPAASVVQVPCSVGGPHGLIAAVNAANHAGGGTLRLAKRCTYTLRQPGGQLGGDDGVPALTGRITIIGQTGTTIARSSARGTPEFRIIEVTESATVAITNLTLRGGRLSGADTKGGGIANDGTITSLSHVSLRNNSAGFGGGVGNDGKIVSIVDDTFSGDSAGAGGGLGNGAGTIVTIAGATFSGNRAGTGGGISNLGTIGTLRHSTITGNRLTKNGAGGGIANTYAVLNMTDDVVSRNSATAGPQASGGGIDNSGRLTLTDSLVSGNAARGVGGGLRNDEQAEPRFSLVVRTTRVIGNTVTSPNGPATGGGIYNAGAITIAGGTVRQNRAAARSGRAVGAGVYNGGFLSVSRTAIVSNLVDVPAGVAQGAGLYVDEGSTKTALDHSSIASNRAVGADPHGGGIFFAGGKPVTLLNSVVSGNAPENCYPPGRVTGCGQRGRGAPDPG